MNPGVNPGVNPDVIPHLDHCVKDPRVLRGLVSRLVHRLKPALDHQQGVGAEGGPHLGQGGEEEHVAGGQQNLAPGSGRAASRRAEGECLSQAILDHALAPDHASRGHTF